MALNLKPLSFKPPFVSMHRKLSSAACFKRFAQDVMGPGSSGTLHTPHTPRPPHRTLKILSCLGLLRTRSLWASGSVGLFGGLWGRCRGRLALRFPVFFSARAPTELLKASTQFIASPVIVHLSLQCFWLQPKCPHPEIPSQRRQATDAVDHC